MNNRSFFLLLLSLAAASSVLANSTVTSVSASQRWPFNGKVDIEYTLTSNASDPVFRVAFYGQINGSTITLSNLEGDGACGVVIGAGTKKVTWDASVDYPNLDTGEAKFAVVALDVTSAANYLVLNLNDYTMSHSEVGPNVALDTCKTTEVWFKRINAGTYYMGSASDEAGREPSPSNGEDKHLVTITKPFYLGVLECTEAHYAKINSDTVSTCKVSRVQINTEDLRGSNYGKTWPAKIDFRVDANSFFGRLRQKTGYGLKFDLPTEGQWELAARDKGDGTYHGDYVWNDGVAFQWEENGETVVDWTHLDAIAWHNDTRGQDGFGRPHEAGTKLPSLNGLYDMHGNVWDLCIDHYTNHLGYNDATDPVGNKSLTASYSVRGGSIYHNDPFGNCRMAMRMGKNVRNNNIGFRMAIQR